MPSYRDGDESLRRPNQVEFTGQCNGKEEAGQREGSGDQQKVSSRLQLSHDLYMSKFSL